MPSRRQMESARSGTRTWISARAIAPKSPHGKDLSSEEIEHVEEGRLDGLVPFDMGGRIVTGNGPLVANPAFRFRAPQGGELRVVGGVQSSCPYDL